MALAAIAAAILFVAYQTTLPERDTFGMTFKVQAKNAGLVLVRSVDRNSQAARAGIHVGDLIAFGNNALDRAKVVYATPGTPVRVVVNGSRVVTLIANGSRRPHIRAILAVRLAFLLVAALLAWRRPEDRPTRALVAFLWCYGLAIAMNNGVMPTPVLSLVVLEIGSGLLILLGTAAAAEFAATFPSGIAPRLPRTLATTCEALIAFTIAGLLVGEWLPQNSSALTWLNVVFRIAFVLSGILVALTLITAFLEGDVSERQRRRWVFLMMGIGLAGPLIDIAVQLTVGFETWVDDLTIVPLAIMPFGLAYAILRHRVIDVGFVLNRAAVYAVVSAIIVGIFILVESLVERFVEQHNHAESIAVRLAVALLLGYYVSFIHKRVDRFIDTIFFRKRHEAEAKLREFALDAPYVTDGSVLLRRCVELVRACAETNDAAVWLRDGSRYTKAEGTFAAAVVDENDAAIVAMRARHVIAELPSLRSALPGVLGFPMTVRGQLVGVLLCGAKVEDETYAPDEREALSAVATAVAQALDGLRVTRLEETVERLLGPRAESATQGAMGTF